jgi:hypothetical protein
MGTPRDIENIGAGMMWRFRHLIRYYSIFDLMLDIFIVEVNPAKVRSRECLSLPTY